MAEHGRRGLRLADEPHGEVGLDQALQRLLDVPRILVLGDDDVEAVDRGDVLALLEIVAPDLHLLARELVAGHDHLLAGVRRIFRIRIAVDDGLHRIERLLRHLLIARHVAHLGEVALADECIARRRRRGCRDRASGSGAPVEMALS